MSFLEMLFKNFKKILFVRFQNIKDAFRNLGRETFLFLKCIIELKMQQKNSLNLEETQDSGNAVVNF